MMTYQEQICNFRSQTGYDNPREMMRDPDPRHTIKYPAGTEVDGFLISTGRVIVLEADEGYGIAAFGKECYINVLEYRNGVLQHSVFLPIADLFHAQEETFTRRLRHPDDKFVGVTRGKYGVMLYEYYKQDKHPKRLYLKYSELDSICKKMEPLRNYKPLGE